MTIYECHAIMNCMVLKTRLNYKQALVEMDELKNEEFTSILTICECLFSHCLLGEADNVVAWIRKCLNYMALYNMKIDMFLEIAQGFFERETFTDYCTFEDFMFYAVALQKMQMASHNQ